MHLHFLRKLAQAYPDIHFTHGAPDQHLAQLAPLAHDLDNLTIQSIALTGQGSINAWRGAGGHWYSHPQQNDFVAYHLDWFRHLAKQMGLESPIHCARDMLFDYPALQHGDPRRGCDFLLINSPPQSGQWSGYDYTAWGRLIDQLPEDARVITTHPVCIGGITCTQCWPYIMPGEERIISLDVTGIGYLSQTARCIIGCVTGPMWTTLNIWSAATVALRVHLLDHERVDYVPERTVHCNSLSLVPEILKDRGLL